MKQLLEFADASKRKALDTRPTLRMSAIKLRLCGCNGLWWTRSCGYPLILSCGVTCVCAEEFMEKNSLSKPGMEEANKR